MDSKALSPVFHVEGFRWLIAEFLDFNVGSTWTSGPGIGCWTAWTIGLERREG